MAQQQERQHRLDEKLGSQLKSRLQQQQQQGCFLPGMNKTCKSSGKSPSFSQSSSTTTPSLSPSPSTSAPPSFITVSASILLPAFGPRFLLCSPTSVFSTRSLLSFSSTPFSALTKAASSSSSSSSSSSLSLSSRNSASTAQHHHRHDHSQVDQDSTSPSPSSFLDSDFSSASSEPITLKQATIEGDAGVIVVVTSKAPAPAPGQKAFADFWTAAAVAATAAVKVAGSKIAETTPRWQQQQPHYCHRQQHSHITLFSFTYLLRLLFLVMTTRNTSATPAPAPAPAPQSSESSQPAPTSSNPSPNAPVKTSDPPPPARLVPDAAAAPPPPSPAPSPTSSSPQSLPHRSSSEVPVSPPASTFGSPPLSTTTTDTSSTHSSSSTIRRTSTANHHTADSQPSGAPYGIIGGSNESSNRIMLTVSLIVVFVILAGMGLVVYCLFRRRSAKRRMHLFGGNGSSKNTSGSLDSGIGSGGKRKSTTARRQSTISVGGGSIIGTGGKGDSMVTALAEMQEQQRRISDVDMSRDLQAMTEQHQNALMTRRTSTLSLGGLHHQNHHQHHLQQNQQHPGSRVVSPTLAPARPRSALAAGYWGGGGGPAGSADPTGEGTRRASMSGGGIVIGSGDYVAGPLGSSSDFRTTVYDDLYYPSRQFLYPSSGGGSSGANSNEQLLPPQHHHHPYYYSSGPPSSANMSRRSSLSPGTYPTHPSSENAGHGQNPSQIFRAKTIGTSNGHGYQQQMQYQQHYPPHAGPGPYRSTPPPHSSTPPPHLNRMSVHQPSATIASSSDDSSETTSNYPPSQQQQKGLEGAGVSAGNSDTIPRSSSPLADPTRELQQQQHYPRRPQSMSMLQNNPPFTSPYEATVGPDRSRSPPPMSSSMGNLLDQNPQYRASYDGSSQLDIPPSITTRRRSMMPSALGPSGSPATSPGGGYLHQQGYPQQQHPYGGGGQDYFQDGQKYSVSPRSVSPYGYSNTPYQDHQYPSQYQYAKRSSTQLNRVPDQQGKSEYIQDGGEGVGVGKGSSLKTVSSSSSSSSGGTSNTASTAPTPTPTSLNLNSVRSKSPPPPQGWPGRSHVNGNSTGHGPIVHISPAPSSSLSLSRASATAVAAGITILTPVDRGSTSVVDLHLTEVLNSPTDSSAH